MMGILDASSWHRSSRALAGVVAVLFCFPFSGCDRGSETGVSQRDRAAAPEAELLSGARVQIAEGPDTTRWTSAIVGELGYGEGRAAPC